MSLRRDARRPCVLATLALVTAMGLPSHALAQPTESANRADGRSGMHPQASELAAARERWRTALEAFSKADRTQPVISGGVLFVGSSSIRLWQGLERDFAAQPLVINRGFGGSTLSDCALFVRDWVAHYQPAHVLVYAGDNDLAQGQTPLQVLESLERFERAVHAQLPQARVGFLSVKPSPKRANLLPEIRQTNLLAAAYAHTHKMTDFIDVFTPMLDEHGQPRPELFRADGLHMNAHGYQIWRSEIASNMAALPDATDDPGGGAAPDSAPSFKWRPAASSAARAGR